MNKICFTSNDAPTVGVEIELALVDEKTMGLSSSILDVLAKLPEKYRGAIKPELMQCYLEINSCVCRKIADAEVDLHEKLLAVQEITDALGLRLFWTATHPFSIWQDQKPSPSERNAGLLENLQDIGRRLVTFGLHVHVALDSGDKAVMMCDRILRHLPELLALTCNSPWWNGRITGLHSSRSKIMEALPTAGFPPMMRNWSEFVWLINHLIDTGFINTIREIWWDVRPHHNFGTVEVRMCDIPGNLHDTLAVAALIQCLVVSLSDEIDMGTYQHNCHPMMVRQNKWHAARYGLDAILVDTVSFQAQPARETLIDLAAKLRPVAERLDCVQYLGRISELASGPTWAQRQLELLKETGNAAEMIRRLTEASRVTAASAPLG